MLKDFFHIIKENLLLSGGAILSCAGLALTICPIPFGAPFLAAGLAVMASSNKGRSLIKNFRGVKGYVSSRFDYVLKHLESASVNLKDYFAKSKQGISGSISSLFGQVANNLKKTRGVDADLNLDLDYNNLRKSDNNKEFGDFAKFAHSLEDSFVQAASFVGKPISDLQKRFFDANTQHVRKRKKGSLDNGNYIIPMPVAFEASYLP